MSAVLIQHVQNSPEWHAWRKNGIGGSDAPVIEEAIMKNAKAYANANAYAYANRTKVADACVETLRLACGIKE
jgi:hypothetical protein